MISTGMHFGGHFGPSNQEPVAWARCELAEHLFQHKTYHVQLNEHLQDIIQINATMQLPTRNHKPAKLDSLNLPWPENQCNFEMYIDDLGLATLDSPNHHKAWKMVASSIEAEYLLLSYPGPIEAPTLPAIAAFDKLVEQTVSERHTLIGIEIDSCRMLCLVPKEKVERFLKLLNTVWSTGRKTFTPREGAKLIGTVILLAVVCLWLKWSYHHLLGDQMNKQLRKNYERIMTKQRRKHNTSESDQLTLEQARINFIVEQISSKPFFNSLESPKKCGL
jgi:hypothetical protein